MVKLKAGTLSKEELVESLMGSTPLKQISKRIDIRWEDPVVPRYNGQRSQRVQCSPAPGIETEKARQIIARRIEQIKLPQGYTPVSYTHLDVYKRQALSLALGVVPLSL